MPRLRVAGQKGWHGVAIASRLPIADNATLEVCKLGHARCVSARIAGIDIQNFYIPAGGDIPDRALNPKFDHKMDFYVRLTAETDTRDKQAPLVLGGGVNSASGEYRSERRRVGEESRTR